MKVLIIGGNRFVGLRVGMILDHDTSVDLHVVNRTGQSPHLKRAAIYKCDRRNLTHSSLDRDWDVILDFACFNEFDAQSSLSYFKQVQRYIQVSTMSVYDVGANLKEDAFSAKTYSLGPTEAPTSPSHAYQLGKRKAEALLAQNANFPMVFARFPYILGPDDYTGRLEFHVQRIETGQPLFVPDVRAKISLLHAQDASEFLVQMIYNEFAGPINVACPQPITMAEFIQAIESRVHRRALLVQKPNPDCTSPYAPLSDFFMDCSLLAQLGIKIRPIKDWLIPLIEETRVGDQSTLLH